MVASLRCSDSLVAGLCREADALRTRGREVLSCLERCQDSGLRRRLVCELCRLQERRRELSLVARGWRQRQGMDALTIEFLQEIAARPLGA